MFPEERRESVRLLLDRVEKTISKVKRQVWAVKREADGRSLKNIRGSQDQNT